MRFVFLAFLIPTLGSCEAFSAIGESNEIKACEGYLTGTLVSPSSYKRVSLITQDSGTLSPEEFSKEAGLPRAQEGIERTMANSDARRLAGHKLALRTVMIQYDADNSFGANLRGLQTCVFRLVDGQSEEADQIRLNIGAAQYRASTIRLAEVSKLRGKWSGKLPKMPEHDCCL